MSCKCYNNRIIIDELKSELEDSAVEAQDGCPVSAIIIE